MFYRLTNPDEVDLEELNRAIASAVSHLQQKDLLDIRDQVLAHRRREAKKREDRKKKE